jgi:hypothetical protein
MSWFVTFGRKGEQADRRVAFVVNADIGFAKMVMRSADWGEPNDPNRDPFNRNLYSSDLSMSEVFGVLTANLQLLFDELEVYETEGVARDHVFSVLKQSAGETSDESAHSKREVRRNLGDALRDVAIAADRTTVEREEEIVALKRRLAESQSDVIKLSQKLDQLEALVMAKLAETKSVGTRGQKKALPAKKSVPKKAVKKASAKRVAKKTVSK